MTDPTSRPSAGTLREERTWREAIRFAVAPLLLLGFAFLGREAWEVVTCPRNQTCKPHLSTMAWGIGLVVGALLIWQRGNVSASLKEAVEAGADIRSRWFTRAGRATDEPGTTVATAVIPPVDPNRPIVTDHDNGVG